MIKKTFDEIANASPTGVRGGGGGSTISVKLDRPIDTHSDIYFIYYLLFNTSSSSSDIDTSRLRWLLCNGRLTDGRSMFFLQIKNQDFALQHIIPSSLNNRTADSGNEQSNVQCSRSK
jgi:hypothetical protein